MYPCYAGPHTTETARVSLLQSLWSKRKTCARTNTDSNDTIQSNSKRISLSSLGLGSAIVPANKTLRMDTTLYTQSADTIYLVV